MAWRWTVAAAVVWALATAGSRAAQLEGDSVEYRLRPGAGYTALSHPDLAARGDSVWLAALGTGPDRTDVLIGEVFPDTTGALRAIERPPAEGGGGPLPPRLAASPAGELAVVWPELGASADGERPVALWIARFGPEGEERPVEALTASGVDTEPAVHFASDGALWVAWTALEAGNREVRACRIAGEARSDWNLSEHPASDQQPALASAPDGSVWAAWSSFRDGDYSTGNYEILARRVDAEGPGPLRRVSVSGGPDLAPEFALTEGGAGLALTWTTSSHRAVETGGLRANAYDGWYDRTYSVARWTAEGWTEPLELAGAPGGKGTEAVDLDRVRAVAGPGDELLLLHHRVLKGSVRRRANPRALRGLRLQRDGTTSSEDLSFGRSGAAQRVAVARMGERLLVADWCEPGPGAAPREGGWLRVVGLPLRWPDRGRGTARSPAERPPLDLPDLPDLSVRPGPRPAVEVAGVELKAYFGNLHVHTDVSVDGRAADGPPAHNLMALRDTAGLDFAALTDHTRRIEPHEWRHLWALAEVWNRPGSFVTLHGFEWSSERLGHKNVIFRDADTAARLGPLAQVTTVEALFEHIGRGDALAIPHHPSHLGGHDWTVRDDELQRLVEIFQKRGGYEHDDSPLARRGTGGKRWVDGRSVRDALALGHRLGIIASPDHGGGLGLAGVWAERLDREAVWGGLYERRTFGTTGAKLALWLDVDGAPPGSLAVPRPPNGPLALRARAFGTVSGLRLVLVVEGREAASQRFEGSDVEHRFEVELPADPSPERGPYVYLRVEQADGHVGWTSPLWLSPNR